VHDETSHLSGVRVAPVAEPRSGTWLAQSPGTDAGPDVLEVRAKVVVNATGVWADELCRLDDPTYPTSIRPAKGIHLTVPRSKLPCDLAMVLPVPEDRRSITVNTLGRATPISATDDTDYSGPLDDPRVEPGDIDYLLNAVNAACSSPLGRRT